MTAIGNLLGSEGFRLFSVIVGVPMLAALLALLFWRDLAMLLGQASTRAGAHRIRTADRVIPPLLVGFGLIVAGRFIGMS